MELAVFGLGKMGSQIARRLQAKGFSVLAWNRSEGPRQEVAKAGVKTFASIDHLASCMSQSPRIFWLMLPQETIDDFLFNQALLGGVLRSGDIVIDGGNSHYKKSQSRAGQLKGRGIVYYDCGTSGGVWGEKSGFALMVGGPKEHWAAVEPVMQALSAGNNFGLVGQSGAGHFAKMVHNGIEYGMMEAIAEGYAIMKASGFGYDFVKLSAIYQEGSVIRGWLIDLTKKIFEHEDIAATSGQINQLGEGRWTVDAAKELGVDARVIEGAVQVRDESLQKENQGKFSNKIVSLLRKQFGGHAVTSQGKDQS